VDVPPDAFDFGGVQLCVHEQCASPAPTVLPTPTPTIFVPGKIASVYANSVACIADGAVAFATPNDFLDEFENYWGWRVMLEEVSPRDPSAPFIIERYFPLESGVRSIASVDLCIDEMLGFQSSSAPDKPYGENLYWAGNENLDESIFEVLKPQSLRFNIWAVSKAGTLGKLKSAILSYYLEDCDEYEEVR
jgi:hypothetical protein